MSKIHGAKLFKLFSLAAILLSFSFLTLSNQIETIMDWRFLLWTSNDCSYLTSVTFALPVRRSLLTTWLHFSLFLCLLSNALHLRPNALRTALWSRVLGLGMINSAQELRNGETFWNWQTKPDKDDFQLNFRLALKIKGKKVSGAFVFSNLADGEWDGADRNVMPFIGKISGNVIVIEFDSEDVRIFEEYDSPFDAKCQKTKGTRVSRATIKVTKGKLEFVLTKGKFIFDLPRKIVMRRMI